MDGEAGSDGDPVSTKPRRGGARSETGLEPLLSWLQKTSRYRRVRVSEGTIELISPEGEKFFCAKVTDSEDPRVYATQRLFRRAFEREERDPVRELKEVTQEELFDLFAITDAVGNLLGASISGYFPLQGTNEAIVFVDYVATDPRCRRRGLARELYLILCARAQERAAEAGHTVRGILGETKSEVEEFWNKLGWRRMYIETEKGIEEVFYTQPPLYWNWEKGTPLRANAQAIRSHLMIWLSDEKRPVTVSELMRMIETIYEEDYTPFESRFASKKAFRACAALLARQLGQIERNLKKTQTQEVILLSQKARHQSGLFRGFQIVSYALCWRCPRKGELLCK